MRGTHGIRMTALALTAAALPTLAFAGESRWNPQAEARIEQLIEQAIQGNSDADRQEQARIDRLVRQAIRGGAAGPMIRPAEAGQPSRLPLAGIGLSSR